MFSIFFAVVSPMYSKEPKARSHLINGCCMNSWGEKSTDTHGSLIISVHIYYNPDKRLNYLLHLYIISHLRIKSCIIMKEEMD